MAKLIGACYFTAFVTGFWGPRYKEQQPFRFRLEKTQQPPRGS